MFALLQAVEQGKNRSCTSTAQAWGKRKKSHEPDFITNIKIKKSTKDCTTDLRPERFPRNTYDPRPVELRQSSKLENFDLFKLNIVTNGSASILHCVDDSKKVNPNAILVEPESDLNVVCTETVTSCNIPSTVLELSAACKSETASFEEFSTSFTKKFKITAEEAKHLEKITREQSDSEVWREHRKGRVTASNAKVFTAKVVDNKVSGKVSSSIKTALGYYFPAKTKALEWGIQREAATCKLVFDQMKKNHKGLKCTGCGIFVSSDYPHISATPDRLLDCKCCGKIPLEVKNPWSGRYMSIEQYLELKCSCLFMRNGHVILRPKHPYYYQVQTHMLATGCKSCVFCVNTWHKKGLHIEVIHHDDTVMQEIVTKSLVFFNSVILPELYTGQVRNEHENENRSDLHVVGLESSVIECVIPDDTSAVDHDAHPIISEVDNAVHVDVTDTEFLCAICQKCYVCTPRTRAEMSIECTICKSWYHILCVGFKGSEKFVTDDSKQWCCSHCSEY